MKEGADSTPNFSATLLASDAPRLEACSNKGLFFKQSIRFSSTRIAPASTGGRRPPRPTTASNL